MFNKNILLTTAENPKGETVFKDLSIDPPTSETEFVNIWKLYFLIITVRTYDEWGIENEYFESIKQILQDSNLIPKQKGLKATLKACRDYIKQMLRIESLQPGVELNEVTGLPSGVTFKVSFREPSDKETESGINSINALYEILEKALKKSEYTIWIAVDRLDVAFSENIELETNALKALFRVYRDLSPFEHLKLKIFLRDDIWRRITEEGFREASHITRTLTIEWNRETLINLIIRRLLNNEHIVKEYDLNVEEILADFKLQEETFYKFFPQQIDVGLNRPRTVEWILGRVKDGKGIVAPREIIHLFNEAVIEQLKKIQIGQNDLENDNLIGRNAFKSALETVSKVRLEQTIYAEYPALKGYIQKLEGEKTEQRLETLSEIWKVDLTECKSVIKRLVDIGFFEEKGDKDNLRYWVPFIYRNELKMIQGSAT